MSDNKPLVDFTLSEEASTFLRDLLNAPDEMCEHRFQIGDGHTGFGLYVCEADYPDEGSSFVQALPSSALLTAPAAAAEGVTTSQVDGQFAVTFRTASKEDADLALNAVRYVMGDDDEISPIVGIQVGLAGEIVNAKFYAPGLPPGLHDLYPVRVPYMDEHTEAWRACAAALHEVRPGFMLDRKNGIESAVAAIKSLGVAATALAGPVLFWARMHPSGELSGEVLPDAAIEDVRRQSGGWMPLIRRPEASTSDVQHSEQLGRTRAALDLLAGLHPELTTDDPSQMAQTIFDHVMGERAEWARQKQNYERNIELRMFAVPQQHSPIDNNRPSAATKGGQQ